MLLGDGQAETGDVGRDRNRRNPTVARLRLNHESSQDQRNPPRIRRNSGRRCNMTRPRAGMAMGSQRSGRQALAALGAAAGKHAQTADGLAALAEAMAALTNELARLIGTFQDTPSPDRGPRYSARTTMIENTTTPPYPTSRLRGACLSEVAAYRDRGHLSQLRSSRKWPVYRPLRLGRLGHEPNAAQAFGRRQGRPPKCRCQRRFRSG